MRAGVLPIALLLLLGGCDGEEVAEDAGAGDAGVVTSTVHAPEPPELGPCTDGFRPVVGDYGIRYCDPWPEGGRQMCSGSQAHFVGESGCRDAGPACPDGEWPEGLTVRGRVVHVRSGAASGDGSRERPLGSIAEGLAVARAGDAVALAKGVYEEAVTMPEGVSLVGACAAGTRLRWSVPDVITGVVHVGAADVAIRDLTIGPAARTGITVAGSAASADLSGVVLEENRGAALLVHAGAEVEARDVLIRASRRNALATPGRGAHVRQGSSLVLEQAVIEGVEQDSVLVHGEGSDATLRRIALIGVDDGSDSHVIGLVADSGASVSGVALAIEGQRGFGALATGAGSRLQLSQAIVSGTHSRSPIPSSGVRSDNGALAEVTRTVLRQNEDSHFLSGGEGSRVRMSDVWATDMREGGGASVGGLAAAGGQMALERVVVSRSLRAGVATVNPGSSLTATDLRIVDTPGSADGEAGYGLLVDSADATLERVSIERSRLQGVGLINEANGSARHLLVREVGSDPTSAWGNGVLVSHGGTMALRHGLVEQVHEGGLLVVAGRAEVEDFVVRSVRLPACAEDGSCAAVAVGVGSYSLGQLSMRSFAIEETGTCGVQLANTGAVDLADGLITGSRIGACVQVPDYPIERLSSSVRYVDNEINLQVTDLPLPRIAAAVTTPEGDRIALEDPCADPGLYFVAATDGEDRERLAVRLTPPEYPFEVRAVSYDLTSVSGQPVPEACVTNLSHRVEVYASREATPPEVPEPHETIRVDPMEDTLPSWGILQTVALELSSPLVLTEGESIIVAVELRASPTESTCVAVCRGHPVVGRSFVSGADAPPYPWASFETKGYDANPRVFAYGSVVTD